MDFKLFYNDGRKKIKRWKNATKLTKSTSSCGQNKERTKSHSKEQLNQNYSIRQAFNRIFLRFLLMQLFKGKIGLQKLCHNRIAMYTKLLRLKRGDLDKRYKRAKQGFEEEDGRREVCSTSLLNNSSSIFTFDSQILVVHYYFALCFLDSMTN